MPISISEQLRIFLYSTAGGVLIAFVYDIFRIKRKAVKTRSIFIHIEDFLYWIIVALIMFAVIYYSNQGEIRGYIFLASLIGILLYVLLLSRFVIASSMFVIRIIVKTILFLWTVFTYPFRILYKFFAMILTFFASLFARIFRKVKRIGRNRIAKVALWRKISRNARKKI